MIFAIPLYDDNPVQRPPVVTWALIGLCVGAYLWQLGQDENAVAFGYGLVPARLMGAQLPPWVGAEITGQAQYYNSFLVQRPFCSWVHRDMPTAREMLA